MGNSPLIISEIQPWSDARNPSNSGIIGGLTASKPRNLTYDYGIIGGVKPRFCPPNCPPNCPCNSKKAVFSSNSDVQFLRMGDYQGPKSEYLMRCEDKKTGFARFRPISWPHALVAGVDIKKGTQYNYAPSKILSESKYRRELRPQNTSSIQANPSKCTTEIERQNLTRSSNSLHYRALRRYPCYVFLYI